MHELLVIRFGALGDLCLLGWTLSRLASAPDSASRRVTLVTKAQLADLAGRLHGVDEVVALPPGGDLKALAQLARSLRRRRWDMVIDAHRVLRSRLLLGLLGRRPRAALGKDTVARLRLLRDRRTVDPALARHMRDRFDALLVAAHLPAGEASPPLAQLADRGPKVALGLAPGAQWDPKRWPPSRWADLVRHARTRTDAPIRVFLGPRERAWFTGSELEAALNEAAPVEVVADRPLVEVATALGGCRVVVCNDSGLLHLAEAVGTPTVALFGPTVAAFGYTPVLETSTVLETLDLDCRPCSRNGKRPCHRHDLACLVRITPQQVWDAIGAHGPWPEV